MTQSSESPQFAVQVFSPEPDALYSLEATAHLAGISRREVLIYCKEGLVHPVVEPPYGILYFNSEAIHAIRRIEFLKAQHGINRAGIRIIFSLLDEIDRLQAEMRFLRGC